MAQATATSVLPGFDFNVLLDTMAAKVAERLRQELPPAAGVSVRPRLLTVDQAAVYLGRTKASVQHTVSAGSIPVVRADRRTFLDVKDLDTWIEQNKRQRVA
jgi:excisionase family DNA binding protein